MDKKNLNNGWVELVNHEIENLDYNFKISEENYELYLNDTRVLFSKGTTRFPVSPNQWFEDKHQNGEIHEPGLVAWLIALSKVFRKKKVKFFDIGALFSYHSFIADKLFENSEVLAIEGNPLSATFIRSSIDKLSLKNVKVDNSVLGLLNGKKTYLVDNFHFITLNSAKGIWILCSILLKYIVKNLLNFLGKRFKAVLPVIKQIRSRTLLSYLDLNKSDNIEIFKIDTEGYQAVFLPPAIEHLCDRNAIILLEIDDPEEMEKFDTTNNNLVVPFLKSGYSAFWLDHRNRSGRIFEVNYLEKKYDKNSLVVLMPKKFYNITL